jgi:hypothetical protein
VLVALATGDFSFKSGWEGVCGCMCECVRMRNLLLPPLCCVCLDVALPRALHDVLVAHSTSPLPPSSAVGGALVLEFKHVITFYSVTATL